MGLNTGKRSFSFHRTTTYNKRNQLTEHSCTIWVAKYGPRAASSLRLHYLRSASSLPTFESITHCL